MVKCSHGSHQRPEFASFMSEVFTFLLEVPKLMLKLLNIFTMQRFLWEKKKILKTWLCLGKSTALTTHVKALFSWLPW